MAGGAAAVPTNSTVIHHIIMDTADTMPGAGHDPRRFSRVRAPADDSVGDETRTRAAEVCLVSAYRPRNRAILEVSATHTARTITHSTNATFSGGRPLTQIAVLLAKLTRCDGPAHRPVR